MTGRTVNHPTPHRRPRAVLALAALALLLPAAPLHAQAAQQPCTYDTCALRVQAPTLTTPQKLVRGADGVEVVKLGLLEPAVAPWLSVSDSAVAHARIYDVLYDRGSIVSMTGTVIAIGAPILLRGTMQKIAFTGVGVGLSMYGGTLVNQANDALAQAIWWYNRELPR
jgi:hypothetical protein